MKNRKIQAAACLALTVSLLFTACGGAPSDEAHSAPAGGEDSGEIVIRGDGAADQAADGYDYADEAPSERGESYLVIDQNREILTQEESLLTFSLKVDTAAYSNVARYIQSGNLPPADAVRTEELINYFNYDAPVTFGSDPIALYTEIAPSPFNRGKQMAMIRVKTRDVDQTKLPRSNLTFLIDTSGSMDSFDKLPLLQEAFGLLTDTLGENDKVSIVTYAGRSAVVLDGVSGADKPVIRSAIQNLDAGGSTAGAEGILTAYALAEKNFIQDGNNRVILATDGDFNVGPSSIEELTDLVARKRDGGVYLSLLGFGTGNLRDDVMETLSTNGNGNYSYIPTAAAAKKVLVDELGSNLFTVADDVKAQIAFNPDAVKSYRLIGYENRLLRTEDFEDDAKDAGEIGVGADVVVLVELEPTDSKPRDDDQILEVRVRYKNPGESDSRLVTRPVTAADITAKPSSDWSFACSVAAFGQLLRNDGYARDGALETMIALASENLGKDAGGYRGEHLQLLEEYRRLAG